MPLLGCSVLTSGNKGLPSYAVNQQGGADTDFPMVLGLWWPVTLSLTTWKWM